MNWVIYVLKCPRTQKVRYVGVAFTSLEARLRLHLREPEKPRTYKEIWIRSLTSTGLTPLIEAIDSGQGDVWADAERAWIRTYRAQGARLTNGTDGGQGTPGRVMTIEQRKALSTRVREQMMRKTPEQRSEWAKQQNTYISPEGRSAGMTREQRSLKTAKWQAAKTPEQRRAISDKRNARLTPEQHKANGKLGAIARYNKQTPEQRSEAARNASRKRWAKR